MRLPFGGHAEAELPRRHEVSVHAVSSVSRGTSNGPIPSPETLGDRAVGVDPAVAQEGPVAASFLLELRVAVGDEDLLVVLAGLGDDPAEGVGDERAAPEFDAALRRVLRGRRG